MHGQNVYVIQQDSPQVGHEIVKIGLSKNPKERIDDLQPGNPWPLWVRLELDVPNPYEMETALHRRYQDHRLSGEWFKLYKEQLDELWQLAQAASETDDTTKIYPKAILDNESRKQLKTNEQRD